MDIKCKIWNEEFKLIMEKKKREKVILKEKLW